MDDYLALLEKARSQLPENVGHRQRWSLPDPDLIKEGRMTVLRNFRSIVEEVRRDETHVAKFLMQQIGTAGQIDGDRLIFTGKLSQDAVLERLRDYVATYVQCTECGSPDTHLERVERVQILKCEACGGHTPVKARKAQQKTRDAATVREGAVIEVTIKVTGSRGEGKASVEGYTVIVPKTKAGTTLKVKITKLSGKLAFAEPV